MRRTSSALAVSFATLSLLVASSALAVDPGARAPELGANDLEGHAVTLESLRGSVVIVDFWASWCEPCADSMPVLESLYTRFRADGLRVVGVSQDRSADNIAPFLRRHPVTFPIVHDAGNAIAGRYAPPTMPTSYLIDREGVVRHVHRGFRAGDAEAIEREVRALLGR